MAQVIDVGQRIYDQLGWVNAWKLQKLTYYVQSWSLAWDGDEIFAPEFQAWPDGPVSPTLHRENKYYRKHHFATELTGAEVSRLSERQIEVIDAVLAFYGRMSSDELIERTHAELPWQEARGGLTPDTRSNVNLRRETMQSFYSVQAIVGADAPIPPKGMGQKTESLENARSCDSLLNEELDRWADTLAWLAVR